MDLPLEPVKEERWPCWRTPYQSVSWAHDPAAQHASFCGPLFATYRTSCDSPRLPQSADDLVLSTDLCGVRCALDALVKYERDVGFSPETPVSKPRGDVSLQVDELAIVQAREKWELYAEALTRGAHTDHVSRTSTPASSRGGLHRSTSTLSSVDLTDSDMSSSLPSTPTRKCTEAIVEVKHPSPVKANDGSYLVSSARPLNAAATSFVPSSVKSEPLSFTTRKTANPSAFINFAFPTQKAPVQIKKDEQGFYSEAEVAAPVPQGKQEACTFLPPFLHQSLSSRRKGPASKTRAIVDKLRSSHNHSHSPIPNPPLYDLHLLDERSSVSEDDRTHISSPSSHEDDDDGWLNISEADTTSKESKARRTRDLFLALTRRRSDSLPSSQTDTAAAAAENEHADIEIPMTTSPSSSPSPLPSQDDGWIDPSPAAAAAPSQAPPQRRTESRPRSSTRRRRSSHAPPAPAPVPPPPPTTIPTPFMPIPLPIARAPVRALPHAHHPSFPTPALQTYTSPNPASFFYSAYPAMVSPVAYTSYMQMQQLQLMQQMQLRGSVTVGVGAGGGRRATVPAANEWFQYPSVGAPFTTTKPPAPAARRELLW